MDDFKFKVIDKRSLFGLAFHSKVIQTLSTIADGRVLLRGSFGDIFRVKVKPELRGILREGFCIVDSSVCVVDKWIEGRIYYQRMQGHLMKQTIVPKNGE